MATIDDLGNKIENAGTTKQGKVSAEEWNSLIEIVRDVSKKAVRSVSINNGQTFLPDESGKVNMVISENNYLLNLSTKVDGNIPYRVTLGSSWKMRITISNVYLDGETQIPVSTPCAITYYRGQTVLDTRTGYDGQTIEFDFGAHLLEGSNEVWARVDNGYGSIKDTMAYAVEAVYLSVSLPGWDKSEPVSGDWPLQISVLGSKANVYLYVDDEGGLLGTQSAGSTVNYNVTVGHTAGVHRLRVFARYADDESIQTPDVGDEFIFVTDTMSTIAIAMSLTDGYIASMYTTLSIPFWAYIPNFTGDKQVALSVTDDLGKVISSSSRTLSVKNGRSELSQYDIPLFDTAYIGERIVKISIDGEERTKMFTVAKGEIELEEATGYDVKFVSAGRSNSDDDFNVWESNGYNFSFSDGFDWSESGSGWNKDKDGNTALHIRRGHNATLNYQPFLLNPAFGNGSDVPGEATGMTISLEIATRNCVKRDAVVVSCMHNGVGFEVNANGIRFASDSQHINADFKEDEHIRIDLVIEGRETIYNYNDNGEIKSSSEAFMWIYLDGVYQQLRQITSATNFMQATAQEIVFGSDDCDIDIYAVRIYRSALTRKQIVDNMAFDTPIAKDKIDIAKRNDILDSAMEVSYAKLRKARPELPIGVLSIDELPATKTWIKLAQMALDNPTNIEDVGKPLCSFTLSEGKIRTQGTSSTQYPMPYHNYDVKAGVFTMNGQTQQGLLFYVDGVLITAFTMKKDYASSEMANNAILSELWNDMSVAASTGGYDTLIAAQSTLSQTKYRQGLKSWPSFIFQYTGGSYKPIGMFNMINYKSDEKVLGFVSPYTWNEQRAQSWEIRDNNVFYESVLNPPRVVEGIIENDAFRYYEALYPKDSTAFENQDFGSCESEDQIAVATDETKDIRRLHNWIASTNQRTATNALLPETVIYGTESYQYDNARYRLAKFVNEAPQYISVDHFIVYYLWMIAHWMYDSGSKNFGVRTDNASTYDKTIWRPKARDCDTGLGINNVGVLGLEAFLELGDYILNGEYVYDQSTMPEGASTILNGQQSAIWQNIMQGFNARVQAMYVYLRSNAKLSKFGYEELETWFESHQSQWSEALYNFGSLQYHGGAPMTKWVESGCGDKKNQRRFWLYYRYLYLDSKFHFVSTEATQCISWRGKCSGADLQVKAYAPMYICLGFGAQGYGQTTRYRYLNLDSYCTVKNELKTTTQDAIFYFFHGRYLTEINDLYKFGDIGDLNLASAIRLQAVRLGINTDKESKTYVNTKQLSLDVSACSSLRVLDLTNCTGFGNGGAYVIDLSKNSSLEEFYCWGSSITGATLPTAPTLRVIEFGANIRQIRLVNLTSLESFSIEGVSNLTAVTVVGTPSIDTYSIISRAYTASSPLTTINIDNIDWPGASIDVMRFIAASKNSTISGAVTIPGKNMVTFADKLLFMERWGNIDNKSNPLYISYTERYISSVSISGEDTIRKAGDYQFTCIPNTSYGNDFTSISWEVSANDYAIVDTSTGVLHVTSVGSNLLKPTITLKVVMVKTDGSSIEATKTLRMYDREAELGDYVYIDGTYSDVLDNSKTLAGICDYVNPNNPKERTCIRPMNLTHSYTQWGLYNSTSDAQNGMGGITLNEYTGSVYDITELKNLTSNISTITDEKFRDEISGDELGFKIFEGDCVENDMGFVTLTSNIVNDLSGYLDSSLIAGERVTRSLLNTLYIVKHRDRILRDSAVGLPIPKEKTLADGTVVNEFDNLLQCMDNVVQDASDNGVQYPKKYAQYYYPAASLCYHFEPQYAEGEVIAECFKRHKWTLKAQGDLMRVYWYQSHGYSDDDPYAIFARAKASGKFTPLSGVVWSSSEPSAGSAWSVDFNLGNLYGTYKYNSNAVRPSAAF